MSEHCFTQTHFFISVLAPAPTPGLFGSAPAPSGGLFGSPAPAPSGGLFGAPAPAPFGAPGKSLFSVNVQVLN